MLMRPGGMLVKKSDRGSDIRSNLYPTYTHHSAQIWVHMPWDIFLHFWLAEAWTLLMSNLFLTSDAVSVFWTENVSVDGERTEFYSSFLFC